MYVPMHRRPQGDGELRRGWLEYGRGPHGRTPRSTIFFYRESFHRPLCNPECAEVALGASRSHFKRHQLKTENAPHPDRCNLFGGVPTLSAKDWPWNTPPRTTDKASSF